MSPTSGVLVALGVLWPTQGWAQTCNVAAGWTCQTVVAPAGQHGVGASVAAASDYVGIAYEVDINGATPFPELVNTHRLKYRGFEWDGTTFQSTGDALLLETVPPDGASDVYTLHAQWYDPTLDTHYITHRSPNLAGCSTAYRDLVETEVVHDALGVSNVISSSPAEDCRDRAYTWLKPDGVGGRGVTVTGKPGSATENVLSAEHAGGVWGPTIEVDAGRSDHAQFYYDGDVQVGAYHAIVDGVDRIYFWMDTPGFVPVDLGAGANLNFPTIGVADGTIKVFARLKPPGRPTFSIVERSCTPDIAAGKTCAQLSDWNPPVIRFSGLGESEMLQWVRADNGREFLVWSEAESPTMWQAHIAETCGVFSNALISHMQTPGVFRDVQSLESGMPKIALDNVNNRVHVVWSEVTDSRPGASASGHVWHGFKSFEDCP